MNYFGSLLCLACEPDYKNLGITINLEIIEIFLNLTLKNCSELIEKCYDYISTWE